MSYTCTKRVYYLYEAFLIFFYKQIMRVKTIIAQKGVNHIVWGVCLIHTSVANSYEIFPFFLMHYFHTSEEQPYGYFFFAFNVYLQET